VTKVVQAAPYAADMTTTVFGLGVSSRDFGHGPSSAPRGSGIAGCEIADREIARSLRFLRTAAHDPEHPTVRIWTLVGRACDRNPVRADIAAMCRVVRVRMCLTLEQQPLFDLVIAEYPRIMLGLFVDRSDAEALEAVQRHLATMNRC